MITPDYSYSNILRFLKDPNSQDVVNGLFEFIGSFFVWFCVYKLYKDKELKGWSIWSTGYFTAWGYWNLFYYPSLNQWWSAAATLAIATANTAWIILAIYYHIKNKEKILEKTKEESTFMPYDI